MGTGISKPTDHTNTIVKAERISAQSKGASERMNIRMVQNVLLIWLDQNIDDTKLDCQNIVARFRRSVNSIHKYTNDKECIEFLNAVNNEKVCIVISGSLGQHTVPQVHDMSQVDSIFIFCSHKQYHESWAKEWPKIKGVFTEITPICDALKKAAQQCEQDSIPISVINISEDVSKKNLNELEPTFMYTQILKEILLAIKFQQQYFTEFITYCHDVFADNEEELKNVKQFEQRYRDETPIWWYTSEYFLYPMLNRALWEMNTNMIMKLGFFINDLHRHIERLHREQCVGESLTVYRGQRVSKVAFAKMCIAKGGLIAFNNFLSTSTRRNVSLGFVYSALTNSEMVGVIFAITIDSTQSTAPFASIKEVGYLKDKEEEILFSMQTVFRIGEVTSIGGNDLLFEVKLMLTSDNDRDLRKLTDYIRKNTYLGEEGWFRWGQVLMKMGQSEKAQQVYEILLLEQTTTESKRGRIYHLLAMVRDERGEYNEALKYYNNALEIYERILSPKDLNLAHCYGDIGIVYWNLGDYPKALLSHEKALEILQQSLAPNHPDIVTSYNNIGLVYRKMGDYSNAVSSHEKALEIRQQSLPSNHSDLDTYHNNSVSNYPKQVVRLGGRKWGLFPG